MEEFNPEKIIKEIQDVLDRHSAVLVNRYKDLVELRLREREDGDPEWSPDVFGKCVYLPTKISPFTVKERDALAAWKNRLEQIYTSKFPTYPKLKRATDIKLICRMRVYDGVLSGLAKINEQMVFFDCLEATPEHSMPREFLYWKLNTDEEKLANEYLQSLRVDGRLHNLYDENGQQYQAQEIMSNTYVNAAEGLQIAMDERTPSTADGFFTYADTNLGETSREEELAYHKEFFLDAKVEGWDHNRPIILPSN